MGWVWDQLNPLLRDHGDVASRGNKLKTPGPKAPGQPHRDPGPCSRPCRISPIYLSPDPVPLTLRNLFMNWIFFPFLTFFIPLG